jgi:hypothetical protein
LISLKYKYGTEVSKFVTQVMDLRASDRKQQAGDWADNRDVLMHTCSAVSVQKGIKEI